MILMQILLVTAGNMSMPHGMPVHVASPLMEAGESCATHTFTQRIHGLCMYTFVRRLWGTITSAQSAKEAMLTFARDAASSFGGSKYPVPRAKPIVSTYRAPATPLSPAENDHVRAAHPRPVVWGGGRYGPLEGGTAEACCVGMKRRGRYGSHAGCGNMSMGNVEAWGV